MVGPDRYAEACQLIHTFWRAMDRDDYDTVLSLLTPDAVWKRGEKWREGHDDIRAALHERPPGLFVRHQISGLTAEETKDGLAVSYLLIANSRRRVGDEKPPFPMTLPSLIIDYTAECSATPQGLRIARLFGHQVFSSLAAKT